jgi:hypothetical protein
MQPIDGATWQDLIVRGEVIAAPRGYDLLDEPAKNYGFDLSTALIEMRDEER